MTENTRNTKTEALTEAVRGLLQQVGFLQLELGYAHQNMSEADFDARAAQYLVTPTPTDTVELAHKLHAIFSVLTPNERDDFDILLIEYIFKCNREDSHAAYALAFPEQSYPHEYERLPENADVWPAGDLWGDQSSPPPFFRSPIPIIRLQEQIEMLEKRTDGKLSGTVLETVDAQDPAWVLSIFSRDQKDHPHVIASIIQREQTFLVSGVGSLGHMGVIEHSLVDAIRLVLRSRHVRTTVQSLLGDAGKVGGETNDKPDAR